MGSILKPEECFIKLLVKVKKHKSTIQNQKPKNGEDLTKDSKESKKLIKNVHNKLRLITQNLKTTKVESGIK